PNGKPLSAKQLKPEWKAALDGAVKAGTIPDIPPSSLPAGGTPSYPAGTDMSTVCSWSTDGCQGPNDIFRAPDNYVGISFDDGPTACSPRLNQFLLRNNISATRFLVGGQVASMIEGFRDIMKDPNQQLAVHTYTHQRMTTLTNEQAVAELGWTMQVILDESGHLPSMWRGPYGDIDNRIRAIAEELLGLRHVSWNYDGKDWCFGHSAKHTACPGMNPGRTKQSVRSYMDKALSGPKSPGPLMLEHELSDTTVGFFERHTWRGIRKNGWKHANIAEMLGVPWYANVTANATPAANATATANGTVSHKNKGRKKKKHSGGSKGGDDAASKTGRRILPEPLGPLPTQPV
ncbi:unnamed protein product, partial [Tilletia controversa]